MMLKKCIVRIMTDKGRRREDSDGLVMGAGPTDKCLFSQDRGILNLIRMIVTLILYNGHG
jgi:hypothetical protein